MDNEKRIKEIEKEFIKLGLIDAVPIIMLGLAMHARFGKPQEPLLEILKNEVVVNGFFLFSIPIIAFCAIRTITLRLEKRNLESV